MRWRLCASSCSVGVAQEAAECSKHCINLCSSACILVTSVYWLHEQAFARREWHDACELHHKCSCWMLWRLHGTGAVLIASVCCEFQALWMTLCISRASSHYEMHHVACRCCCPVWSKGVTMSHMCKPLTVLTCAMNQYR